MWRNAVACLLMLTISLAAVPQTSAPQSKDVKPARPPMPGEAEMKRLSEFYLGTSSSQTWDYSEIYPNGAKNTGVYESKAGPGGNSLLNSFHSRGPVGDFDGMLIFTWDAEAKGYKAFVLGGDFAGALVENGQFDGDKLIFTGELPAGARKIKIRNVSWKPTPDTLVSEEYMTAPNGTEKLVVKVEATRRR